MTFFVVAFFAAAVGCYIGHAHARWIIRDELRGIARRVGEYTDPRKPW